MSGSCIAEKPSSYSYLQIDPFKIKFPHSNYALVPLLFSRITNRSSPSSYIQGLFEGAYSCCSFSQNQKLPVGGIPRRAFGLTYRNKELGQQAQTGGKRRRSRRKSYGRRPQGESRGSGYANFAKQRAARVKMMRRRPRHQDMGFAREPNLAFERPSGPLRLRGISANKWAESFEPSRAHTCKGHCVPSIMSLS